jgi:multiple sugar transport system ATP-binding protein
MNFIECAVAGTEPGSVQVQLPDAGTITVPVSSEEVRAGDRVTLGIRPDHVNVSGEGHLSGRIELVEELGENHLLYVDIGKGRRLTVREPGDAHHGTGQEVGLFLAHEFCHLFKESGEALPLPAPTGSPSSRAPAPATSSA